jgi:hypothetical protein
MIQREKELNDLLKKTRKRMKQAPAGSLRIYERNGNVSYYSVVHGKAVYIRKNNIKAAENLAQKSYDKKLEKRINSEIGAIRRYRKTIAGNIAEDLYPSLPKYRQQLLKQHIITDEEYAAAWLEKVQRIKEDDPLPIRYKLDPITGFYTEKGELVRSKSEKIIADKLLHTGIPYVYEMPLDLGKHGFQHPDFTILNVYTREVFYWEHLGRMDESDYLERNLGKINDYQLSHILPGKQLILTHETEQCPLDTRIIDEIIYAYFF